MPERKFYNRRCVHPNAKFQKQHPQALMLLKELLVPLRRTIPAIILHKGSIAVQVHCHRLATDRAIRNQLSRNSHILLLFQHFPNSDFIIIRFPAAWLTALKQAIISLHIEKPLFIKASFLKTMVYISCDDKVILICHQAQKLFINRLRCIHITVDKNITAPITPKLFLRRKRIKATRVHVTNAIFLRKICKILLKPLPCVGIPSRCRQAGACTDNNSLTFLQCSL